MSEEGSSGLITLSRSSSAAQCVSSLAVPSQHVCTDTHADLPARLDVLFHFFPSFKAFFFVPWALQGVSNVSSLTGPFSLLKPTLWQISNATLYTIPVYPFHVRTVIHLSWTGYSRLFYAAYVKTLSSWFLEKENLLKHRYSLTFVGWNMFLVGVPAENPGRKTGKPHTGKPLAPWGFEPGS